MNNMIELSRNNVTVGQFLAYVRHQCEQKEMVCGIETEDFINPVQLNNTWYITKDGKKISYSNGYRTELEEDQECPCRAETIKTMPLDWQTYMLCKDGTVYNEICEFTYDTDKKGHGYYFQINKD